MHDWLVRQRRASSKLRVTHTKLACAIRRHALVIVVNVSRDMTGCMRSQARLGKQEDKNQQEGMQDPDHGYILTP